MKIEIDKAIRAAQAVSGKFDEQGRDMEQSKLYRHFSKGQAAGAWEVVMVLNNMRQTEEEKKDMQEKP